MLKIKGWAAATLISGSLFAQEPADALRFSYTVPSGTARNQAIGGAMGSLGGDITAAFVNPAGLAFYRTGDLTISPYFRFGETKSTFFGRQEKDTKNNLSFGTTGFVIGSGDGQRNRNAALSIAFNRMADFNGRVLYRGRNNLSSYSQRFLEELEANNVRDGSAASDFPFGASLAINTFWIDTADGWQAGNKNFRSLAAPLAGAGGLLQEQMQTTRGGINEFALGLAVGPKPGENGWMLGGTIGIPVLYFNRQSAFREEDATTENNNFDAAIFNEEVTSRGVGFNLKLGAIYKPQEFLRFGLAFHTPTVYSLTDQSSASMKVNTEDYQGIWEQSDVDVTGAAAEMQYLHITPYKLIGSVSYVLREIEDVTRQRGFLTADVEYVNYKASSYEVSEENAGDEVTRSYFKSLNSAIDNAYKGAFNFRVGGELKFTTIMFRLGAAFYGNPYKNINGEKANRLNLSGGLGYRNKGFFIDLAYVHAMEKDVHFAYRLANRNMYQGAQLKNKVGNALMTLGFKF
ncbi:MAG TPA: aromatic hydrocarbon degradation protein [Chitinophagaceae bacterium]|jgi:hypothetical protein|nr:aromatic hydrocarbon degradation protein [Chitinophagaceae bacterium]